MPSRRTPTAPHAAGTTIRLALAIAAAVACSSQAVAEEIEAPRPIVALAAAAARTDSLGALIAAVSADDIWRDRTDEAFRTISTPLPHVVTTYETQGASGTFRQMMVAPSDPFFSRWQSDANERLAAERASDLVPQGGIVVVCEAGCISDDDKIVYEAPADPAGRSPDAAVEETAVADGNRDSAASRQSEFTCLAGCYGGAGPQPKGYIALSDRLALAVATALAKRPRLANEGSTRASATRAGTRQDRMEFDGRTGEGRVEDHIMRLPPVATHVSR